MEIKFIKKNNFEYHFFTEGQELPISSDYSVHLNEPLCMDLDKVENDSAGPFLRFLILNSRPFFNSILYLAVSYSLLRDKRVFGAISNQLVTNELTESHSHFLYNRESFKSFWSYIVTNEINFRGEPNHRVIDGFQKARESSDVFEIKNFGEFISIMKASNDIVFNGYFFSVNSPKKIASSLYSKESGPNFNDFLGDDELFLFLEMSTENQFGDSIIIQSRSDIDLKIKDIEEMAKNFISKFKKGYFLMKTSKELCDFLTDLLKECFDIETRGAADYKYRA